MMTRLPDNHFKTPQNNCLGSLNWSIFDLDHTLFLQNSSFLFGRYLYQQGWMTPKDFFLCLYDYFLHKVFHASMLRLHEKIFKRIFYKKPFPRLQFHIEQFLDQELKTALNPVVYLKLQESLKTEKKTLILSSGPDFLVGAIAKRLNVDIWKATNYNFDRGVVENFFDGQAKADFLFQYVKDEELQLSNAFIYSDSILDLPLLKMAGHPVAVRPDRALRKHCLKNKWLILN